MAVDHKHANESGRVYEGQCDGDEPGAEADGDLGRVQPEPAEECKLVRTLGRK